MDRNTTDDKPELDMQDVATLYRKPPKEMAEMVQATWAKIKFQLEKEDTIVYCPLPGVCLSCESPVDGSGSFCSPACSKSGPAYIL